MHLALTYADSGQLQSALLQLDPQVVNVCLCQIDVAGTLRDRNMRYAVRNVRDEPSTGPPAGEDWRRTYMHGHASGMHESEVEMGR